MFDSGFDDSVDASNGGGVMNRAGGLVDTGTGGILGYFRGNVSFLFLALMWVTFGLEWAVLLLVGYDAFASLFVLRSNHPEFVWTWVTSIFAHSPTNFFHIVGNSIVLYFFGPLVERYVGSRKFAGLFLAAGVLAGIGHVGAHTLFSALGMFNTVGVTGVLGASGAVFAVLGVLTVLNPDLRIYLYFLIPVPLWLFTLGFALLSVVFFVDSSIASSAGQGGVAHFAHLVGLVVGLAYGQRVKGRQNVPNKLQFGGGFRGPGGPGRF